jgi:single-strand DNA-binding protein
MNKICIIGRLTADPQLTYTQGGAPVCKFSIAYNRDGFFWIKGVHTASIH